jgi:NADPH:quinone reductase
VKAIGLMTYGGPDVLIEVDRPEPVPGPGEVRIRVAAAAISPTDTLLRAGEHSGRLHHVRPPYIPGMDAAGEIDAIGPGVAGWETGDQVMAIVIPHRQLGGAYARKVVVPADSVARIPAGASLAEASTLPMNGLTARATLDALALPAGAVLAVTGAAGAYGGYLTALANHEGLRVIADATAADEELVRGFGASQIVARGDDVATRLQAAHPAGVDAVADGALLFERVVPAIRDGGQLAIVRGWTGEAGRGITVRWIRVHRYARERVKLDQLRELAERGVLALRVAGTYPAAQAADAHRQLERGGVRGRIVLLFD